MHRNSLPLFRHLALGALLLGLPAATQAATPTLRYTLAMPAPQTHYFEVKMDLGGFGADYTDVKMPVWAPGSYLVREFSRHVEGFQARSADGKALTVEKLNKNTWRVRHPKQASFQVSYRVYAFELSVRTSFIDADHGYLNGSSVFMYPADNKDLGSTLTVEPAAGWSQVSTALRPAAGKLSYKAENYDELADSPIEIGNHKVLEFTANGVKHQVAMAGTYVMDETKLLADMKQVCEEAHKVVGRNPLDRYLFIVLNAERAGGGLEHQNSTTLVVSRASYANPAGYKGFLNLVSHEYFHLWNVKRIRPAALGPFDYDRENYTNLLWLSEGITEYFSNVITARAGFFSQQEYLDNLASQIARVENTPGNKVESAAEASFNAWIHYYRTNENSNNSQISYYDKGEVIGMVLDLMILNATKGEKQLDDVLSLLYDKYYKQLGRGFSDQEFQDAVAQVAGQGFDQFFKASVYGTKTLDYATALGYAGLSLSSNPGSADGSLGSNLSNRTGKLLVTGVERDGAAWVGGLNVNDEILQINGAAPGDESMKQLIGRPVGTEIKLQVKRDGLPRDLSLKMQASPARNYQIQPLPGASATQQKVLAKWLSPAQ
jgi:predicted metalloprotease with PDZ domain